MALPTVKIQGKEYVLVKDRVLEFNEKYPYGSIKTEILSENESKQVVIKAVIWPDYHNERQQFIAHSQATIGDGYINKTAALENAETSAVGRALAFMGIGVIESIASADEINKATTPVRSKTAPKNKDQITVVPEETQEWKDQVAAVGTGTVKVVECSECAAIITTEERDYSVKFWGRPLCRDCQKIIAKK